MQRQLILAGNSEQAHRYIRSKGFQMSQFWIVMGPSDLTFARRGSKVWVYAGWYMRKDISDLRDIAAAREIEFIDIAQV